MGDENPGKISAAMPPAPAVPLPASPALRIEPSGPDGLTLRLEGRLDSHTTGAAWRQAMAALDQRTPRILILEASGLEYLDGSAAALFLEARRRVEEAQGTVEIRGLHPDLKTFLDLFADVAPRLATGEIRTKRRRGSQVLDIGRMAIHVCHDFEVQVSFLGEMLLQSYKLVRHPRRFRWHDALLVAESAGANALPIIALLGFLIGLIMAFQSAIPLKRFAAEIFVADLVAISIVKELGPLMTAIILAGRSGSAFAAELGTMKVNAEIDALTTMGLSPVQFLVLPRLVAGVVMTPLLTLFTNLFGLAGGAVVMLSLGFPLVTYLNQVSRALKMSDLVGGLFKSLAFGVLVTGIGCLRGLRTGSGAVAVGRSTTQSVVSGLVLIIIADGVFSVVYFYLGI